MVGTAKTVNIVEISTVIQGEGRYAGTRAVLVRTTGCPLRCQFGDNVCDSAYTSWSPEKGQYSINDVISYIKKMHKENVQASEMMITGGEPCMIADTLDELIHVGQGYGMNITIETAGTYSFNADRYKDDPSIFLSISPKLTSSVPTVALAGEAAHKRHKDMRLNYDILGGLIGHSHKRDERGGYQLKFVITSEDDINEIMLILAHLPVPSRNVYLMPEGVVANEINARRRMVLELAIKHGFNYSDRLHVLAYDDKRNV